MKEQFVPDEIALMLMDLGFNEQCLNTKWNFCTNDKYGDFHTPLWQQAIYWLVCKFQICIEIEQLCSGKFYTKITYFTEDNSKYNTIIIGKNSDYIFCVKQAILKAIELIKL